MGRAELGCISSVGLFNVCFATGHDRWMDGLVAKGFDRDGTPRIDRSISSLAVRSER